MAEAKAKIPWKVSDFDYLVGEEYLRTSKLHIIIPEDEEALAKDEPTDNISVCGRIVLGDGDYEDEPEDCEISDWRQVHSFKMTDESLKASKRVCKKCLKFFMMNRGSYEETYTEY